MVNEKKVFIDVRSKAIIKKYKFFAIIKFKKKITQIDKNKSLDSELIYAQNNI